MEYIIMELNTINKPYLKITTPDIKETKGNTNIFYLTGYGYDSSNYSFIHPEYLVNEIISYFKLEKYPKVKLYIKTSSSFNKIFSLPLMSKSKAYTLFKKEYKESIKEENYFDLSTTYKHDLGYITNTYFYQEEMIKSIKLICKMLGTKLDSYYPYGYLIYEKIEDNEYLYFDIDEEIKVCTMLLVINRNIISSYTFGYETKEDILREYLLVISKHEFELSRKEITNIYSSKSITLDKNIEIKELQI